MFTIPEEIYLISIDEVSGLIHPGVSTKVGYGLAGAIFAEICLRGMIDLDEKKHVILVEEKLTGDDLLDDTIAALHTSQKPHKAAYWLAEISDQSLPLQRRLATGLENLGVIYREGKRSWLVAPCKRISPLPAHAKYWIKTRLRQLAIQNYVPELRDLMFLRLAQASGMLGLIFTKDERHAVTTRLNHLLETESRSYVGEQVFETVLQALTDFSHPKK